MMASDEFLQQMNYRSICRGKAAAQVGDVRRKRYCQVCGKEINVYDGDILEYDNGFVICEECRQKALKNNQ